MATAKQSESYYFRNRKKVLKRQKAYFAANKEKIAKRRKKRLLKISPDAIHLDNRRRQVKYVYKLSATAHEHLLKQQNYKCPITGKEVDLFSAIDHDHSCCPGEKSCGNCIRGIIDKSVNSALGIFKNSDWLLTAYLYLRWGQR